MPAPELTKEELLRLAFQDELTSLYNRRYLYNYLANEVDWSKTDVPPLSLMMIDVDFFKEINDTYGHLTGDAALKHLAKVIKKAIGNKGIAVRYAGDEFSILMPATDKAKASKLGEKVRQTVKETSLTTKGNKSISFSISGGVAAFPADARSAERLIDEADKELYLSKRSGRNRISGGEIIDKEMVSERELKHMKTIPCPVFIGREEVFKTLNQALSLITEGKNIFLLLEGETGLGKTRMFKESKQTGDDRFITSFLRCNETDQPNPYKSIINQLRQLFDRKTVSPENILGNLSENYRGALKKILPGLFAPSDTSTDKAKIITDAEAERKLLFEALTELLILISEIKCLWLFFDEFQNIDAGSLEVIKCLVESDRGRVAFGGALRIAYLDKLESSYPQVDSFLSEMSGAENYKRISLTKLDQFAGSRIISAVLPKREVFLDFDERVYKTTQGNPLFIEELLKNFILKKYFKKGKEWEFREVMQKDWPTDLDALIQENLTLLDEHTTQIVHEAAVVGTELDLSVIKDVSLKNEGETLEMLDKAKKARIIEEIDPLLKPDQFTFVNQRIQEITYDTIDEDTRKSLHEKVGEVEEKLYSSNPDEAASALAFHFAKAGNQAKAGVYEKRVLELAQNLFRADEVDTYYERGKTIDRSKIKEAITPLATESMKTMHEILRGFCAATKNLRLYPEGSTLITQSFSGLVRSFNTILNQVETFTISETKGVLQINTVPIDAKTYGTAVDEVLGLWKDHYIKSVTFAQGLTEEELEDFLKNLDLASDKGYAQPGYWNKFLEKNNIDHLGIAQRAFITKGKISKKVASTTKVGLTPETIPLVREFLRYLCASIENTKLYPIESQITRQAIQSLNNALRQLFNFAEIINLGTVEDVLLLNGTHLPTRDFGVSATTLVTLIQKYDLKSITLLQEISLGELEKLMRLLGNASPEQKISTEDWSARLAEIGIDNALVGQLTYSLDDLKRMAKPQTASTPEKTALVSDQKAPAQVPPPQIKEDLRRVVSNLLKGLPDKLLTNELIGLVERLNTAQEESLLTQLLTKFLKNFQSNRAEMKRRAGQIYSQLLTKIPETIRIQLVQQATPVLKESLRSENDNSVWPALIESLSGHLRILISLRSYETFHNLCAIFRERTDLSTEVLSKYHDLMQNLSKDELFSGVLNDLEITDAEPQKNLIKTLVCMGIAVVPDISERIHNTEKAGSRSLLASIIKEIGPEAHDKFMDVFNTTTEPEKRQRLISVLDIIAPADSEVIFAELIRSSDPGISNTAFATLKRLDKETVLKVLLPALKDKKREIIVFALNTLSELGYPEASRAIAELLKVTTDKKLQMDCCEALGELGEQLSIPVLIEALGKRRFLGIIGGYSDEVRGKATRALGYFKTPQAQEVLQEALNDPSPLVRAAARLGLKT